MNINDFNFFSKGEIVNIKCYNNINLKSLYKESLKDDIFIKVLDSSNNTISEGKILKIRRFIWNDFDKYIEKSIDKMEVYEYNDSFYVVEFLNDRVVAFTKYSKVYNWDYFDNGFNIIKSVSY